MKLFISIILFFGLMPAWAHAEVKITEVMYDPSGSDTGREWIEVYNDGSDLVTLSDWRLFEGGSNHKITNGESDAVLPPKSYAVIADNVEKFSIDYPRISGSLFDSVFSLKNTGETIALKDEGLAIVSEIAINPALGGNDDGNSLSLRDGRWVSATPSPGSTASLEAEEEEVEDSGGEETSTKIPAKKVIPEASFAAIAEGDTISVAGGQATFSGRAYGLKGEPLLKERYVWNFGDGATGEGKSVVHAYRHPGEYVISLDVVSGEIAVADRIRIKIIPAALRISESVSGARGHITIENTSTHELDLSGWYLRADDKTFMIPARTMILSKGRIAFPNETTGLVAEGEAELLYPNGEKVEGDVPLSLPPVVETPLVQKPISVSQVVPQSYAAVRISGEKIPLADVALSTASSSESSYAEVFGEEKSQEPSSSRSGRERGWIIGLFFLIVLSGGVVVLLRQRGHTDTILSIESDDTPEA